MGRDLGPAIDVGPAMTRKILNAKGNVIYRSTVQSLTEDEKKSPDEIEAQKEYNRLVKKRQGNSMKMEELESEILIHQPFNPMRMMKMVHKYSQMLMTSQMIRIHMTNMLVLQ